MVMVSNHVAPAKPTYIDNETHDQMRQLMSNVSSSLSIRNTKRLEFTYRLKQLVEDCGITDFDLGDITPHTLN